MSDEERPVLRSVKGGKTGKSKPPAPPPGDPRELFARRMGEAAATCDQVVAILCRGGYVFDIVPLIDDRHSIRGVLDEAPGVYDFMTSPVEFSED